MKNYFTILLLAMIAIFTVSCDDRSNDTVGDGDTYSVMKDITGSFSSANSYTITQGINIKSTDVALVYRNVSNTTTPIWQLLPIKEYLSGGRELDYTFLFDTANIEIYLDSNFDLTTAAATEASTYMNNQRFRIVLVPASMGKNASLDYKDYQSVIKYYNIPDRN